MEIYIIRSSNPLDMEGSADVAAVFADKDVADDAARLLNEREEARCREAFNDRWRSFAIDYAVEAHPVLTRAEAALA